MHSDLCETDIIEDIVRRDHSVQAKLEGVLFCKSPFYAIADMAADLIRSNRELIDNPRHNFSILDPLIEHIESKIFFAKDAEELVFNLRQSGENIKLLSDAYCSWETALEQIFAWRLCTGGVSSLHDYRLNNRFQRLLKRETSMLRARPLKRALFIGSGPFPISAIWLHRILGVPVDGLDVSVDAVKGSRELIEKLGFGHAINIIHECSPRYDVSSYDLIIIALLAKPKLSILDNIHESAKDDCEIVCRTSFGLRSVIYEPTIVSQEMLEKFSIEDARIISGNCDDTISSLLLRKVA